MKKIIFVVFMILMILCSCTNNIDKQGALNESANKEVISKESEDKENKEDSSSSCVNKKIL